jgi:hypothetical protein
VVAHLELDGLDHSAALEAAARRWILRLEQAHRLTRCDVSIHIGHSLLGLARRATIDLTLGSPAGEVAVHHAEWFRDETQLFFVVSNAFRDAHHRLEHGARPAQ